MLVQSQGAQVITPDKLQETLTKLHEQARDFNTDLGNAKNDVLKAKKREEKAVANLEEVNRKMEILRKALILADGIPEEIKKLRDEIVDKKFKVTEEDIKVSQQKKLFEEIERLTDNLQKQCPHPVILETPGYVSDPENAYPTQRRCLICSLTEAAKDFESTTRRKHAGTIFRTLDSKDNRLVEPGHRFNLVLGLWQPLGAMLKPIEEEIVKVLNAT